MSSKVNKEVRCCISTKIFTAAFLISSFMWFTAGSTALIILSLQSEFCSPSSLSVGLISKEFTSL